MKNWRKKNRAANKMGENVVRGNIYDEAFYMEVSDRYAGVYEEIARAVFGWFAPKSVVDVGCGTGGYLGAFQKHGCEVLGIDGAYVDKNLLLFDPHCFLPFDLTEKLALDRRFDLCMSVEVGEHLPPERAESFVDDLTALSDIVLFSAAIPGQSWSPEQTGHVNERPVSYWAGLFAQRGYRALDCIRPLYWCEESSQVHYIKRNALVYVHERVYDRYRHIPSLDTLDVASPAPLYKEIRELHAAKCWNEEQYLRHKADYDELKTYTDELQQAKDWLEGQYNNYKERCEQLENQLAQRDNP